jgi:hypothetical protein
MVEMRADREFEDVIRSNEGVKQSEERLRGDEIFNCRTLSEKTPRGENESRMEEVG